MEEERPRMNLTSAKRGLTSAGKRGAMGADDLEEEPQKKPKRRKAHVEVRTFFYVFGWRFCTSRFGQPTQMENEAPLPTGTQK